MASYSTQYYATGTPAVPIPSKADQYAQYYGHQAGSSSDTGCGSAYSASPSDTSEQEHEHEQRERDASVTSGGLPSSTSSYYYGVAPSYGATATTTTTSYLGAGDYGVGVGGGVGVHGGSAANVDFNDYMQARFDDSFDPIPLDRSLARQAQTSGKLNNKHRELLEMQAAAQTRLAKSRARFQQGLSDAREVHADLEWTSKKVSAMKKKAEKKHAKEYQKARERYPSPDY
ncbi:hypothetical protein GGR54DRAFT_528760 [Hypoxylon sp. NC1633]|nr:hypothetical protein GGR54DRAFT_528760 [Hypoxylon sp. NC1633]